jgi:hypothetical protein
MALSQGDLQNTNGSQFKKYDFPNFGELDLRFDVAQLILDAKKLANLPADTRYDELISSRSYIASHFPIKESGYVYTPVTRFKMNMTEQKVGVDLKSIAKESGLKQFHRGYSSGSSSYVPELDERRYTNIPDDLPPYLASALRSFTGQVGRTRFALLKTNQKIKEHVDNNLDHTVRIHIPLITNKDCIFCVNRAGVRELKHLPADGRAFFVNTAFPHKVENNGVEDRLHLIVNLNTQHDIHHLCLTDSLTDSQQF